MNINALMIYDFHFVYEQNGCILVFALHRKDLFNLFNCFIVGCSWDNRVYVIESDEKIDLYELARLLRRQQRENIVAHFRNIFYLRPISLYQLSMIIENTDSSAPIFIPDFLFSFKEEGLSDVEKIQQLQVLKKQMLAVSASRPIIIGATQKDYQTYPWVFEMLEDICKQTFNYQEKEQLESTNSMGIQLDLF